MLYDMRHNLADMSRHTNKRPMGLVAPLAVLNHLPYDIKLRFMPNGNVAVMKYSVVSL